MGIKDMHDINTHERCNGIVRDKYGAYEREIFYYHRDRVYDVRHTMRYMQAFMPSITTIVLFTTNLKNVLLL